MVELLSLSEKCTGMKQIDWMDSLTGKRYTAVQQYTVMFLALDGCLYRCHNSCEPQRGEGGPSHYKTTLVTITTRTS